MFYERTSRHGCNVRALLNRSIKNVECLVLDCSHLDTIAMCSAMSVANTMSITILRTACC